MPDETIAARPTLTGEHALDGFAYYIYAAVHDMELPEAEVELLGRPEAHGKYIKAARGALLYCRRLTGYGYDGPG